MGGTKPDWTGCWRCEVRSARWRGWSVPEGRKTEGKVGFSIAKKKFWVVLRDMNIWCRRARQVHGRVLLYFVIAMLFVTCCK